MAVGSISALRKTIKTKQRYTASSKPNKKLVSFSILCGLHYLLFFSLKICYSYTELKKKKILWSTISMPSTPQSFQIPIVLLQHVNRGKLIMVDFNIPNIRKNPTKKPRTQPHTATPHRIWKLERSTQLCKSYVCNWQTACSPYLYLYKLNTVLVSCHILSCYNIDLSPFQQGKNASNGNELLGK